MEYAIEVTQEIKEDNPKHFKNAELGIWKLFSKESLPKQFNNTQPYNPLTVGFKRFEYPQINNNQKLGELYYSKSRDLVTNEKVTISADEAKNRLTAKVSEYRGFINETNEELRLSSKARALGKVNQGFTNDGLNNLTEAYTKKKEVAQAYIDNPLISEGIILELIKYEVEADYTEGQLDGVISYLNSVYSANIPMDATDLIKYCYLIVTKFNLGQELSDKLTALCEYFRSKLITNLDNLEFEKIDLRLQLVATLTNESDINYIINMKNEFDNI